MAVLVDGKQLNLDPIIVLIKKEKKFEAIMYLRENIGLNLKDSKEISDNLIKNPNFYTNSNHHIKTRRDSYVDTTKTLSEFDTVSYNDYVFDGKILMPLIEDGKVIEAIKFVKRSARIGLKEAKEIVEIFSTAPYTVSDKKAPRAKETPTPTNHKEVKTVLNDWNTSKKQHRRGGHFITKKSSNLNNYIFFGILIAVVVYLYLTLA